MAFSLFPEIQGQEATKINTVLKVPWLCPGEHVGYQTQQPG